MVALYHIPRPDVSGAALLRPLESIPKNHNFYFLILDGTV